MKIATLLLCLLICVGSAKAQDIFRATEVDSRPLITGGSYTLTKFIGENLQIPEAENLKIHILTSFVVEVDGSLSDIQCVYLRDEELLPRDKYGDETAPQVPINLEYLKMEIVRVLAKYDQKFIPAMKDGAPVRCLHHFPVNLNIE
ncbi:MAG: hypothetical protein ITG00_08595 [Flavobacterium sp.]|nr:hypothetical protein [Flavobacterium sp.]